MADLIVPKVAALSTAASRAISFTKKNWIDTPSSGTPITAADMNRIEQAIVDINTVLSQLTQQVEWLKYLKIISGTATEYYYGDSRPVSTSVSVSSQVPYGAVLIVGAASYRAAWTSSVGTANISFNASSRTLTLSTINAGGTLGSQSGNVTFNYTAMFLIPMA